MNMKKNKIIRKIFKYPAITALFTTFFFGIIFLIHINYFPMRSLSPMPWRVVIVKKSFWIMILFFYTFSYIEILFRTPSNNEEDGTKDKDDDKEEKTKQDKDDIKK